MKRPLALCCAIIAISVPATPSVSAVVRSAQTDPATQTPPAQPSAPPQAEPQPAAIAKMVDRDFSSYDTNQDGELSPEEFSAWIVKLRKPSAAVLSDADARAWSAKVFAVADTSRDQMVSKSEMTQLLLTAVKS